jgi:hypothetical protein
MMLGLSLSAFTTLHVIISLVGIAAGMGMLLAMLQNRRSERWTAVFLATTVVTGVTGFMFPYHGFLPSHAFGVVSLVVLAAAIAAFYPQRLVGPWRPAFIVSALLALYLNAFVAIVQAFQKIPFMRVFAPTQTEAPFAIAQLVLLIAFLGLGFLALRQFRPQHAATA